MLFSAVCWRMSLPVWEEWIEIIRPHFPQLTAGSLFPYGKSGLKSLSGSMAFSLPRLFPYGKSGLKSPDRGIGPPAGGLFPYGKSGLKYVSAPCGHAQSASLPVWEEWIEIPCRVPMPMIPICLFPYGKSGLKFFVPQFC